MNWSARSGLTKSMRQVTNRTFKPNLGRIDPPSRSGFVCRHRAVEVRMVGNPALGQMVTRRQLLGAAGVGALALSGPSWAQTIIDLALPGGPDTRQITTAFPQKGPMILQRTRPPLAPPTKRTVRRRQYVKGSLRSQRFSHRQCVTADPQARFGQPAYPRSRSLR
jgi:hypothetical protein